MQKGEVYTPTFPYDFCSRPQRGTISLSLALTVGTVRMGSFTTQQTCPGGRRWVDPIPLLDGHFTPDGSGFAVTDVAGQVQRSVPLGSRRLVDAARILRQADGPAVRGRVLDTKVQPWSLGISHRSKEVSREALKGQPS